MIANTKVKISFDLGVHGFTVSYRWSSEKLKLQEFQPSGAACHRNVDIDIDTRMKSKILPDLIMK